MNTYTTASDRLRFRDSRPVPYGNCGICGQFTLDTMANPFPKHDGPAHEVWALETYGMHAVAFDVRDRVEGWAADPATMPSADEFRAERLAKAS